MSTSPSVTCAAKRRVQRTQLLGRLAQQVSHGPEGGSGHDPALGQRPEVPRRVDGRPVMAGTYGDDRRGVEERSGHDS